MTNLIPTISAGSVGLMTFQPLPDVEPFSIRSAASYEEILSTIRVWIRDQLVPYLNADTVQANFQSNIDTMIDTVNKALSDQSATVTAALNQAVNEVITADIPVTSGILASNGIHVAPAPSGGDDTAVLQALLSAAQTTGGTLQLQAGTYLANLATAQSFAQPVLRGQGKDRTTIKAFVNTSPVLRLKGGSGALSGGFISDLTLAAADAGGGIGLQLADCGGVHWSRLRITGAFSTGLDFLSENTNAFCEFNCGDVEITTSVAQAVHYRRTGGNESFHGSGLTKGSVINQDASATQPVIIIDSGCFPYGAPLDVTIFPRAAQPIIQNNNTSRQASFQGNIDLEVGGSATNVDVADRNGNIVYLEGHINGLNNTTGVKLAKLILAERVYYQAGNTLSVMKPFSEGIAVGTGTTQVLQTTPGASLIQVDVVASNYHYAFLLHCWQSPYDSTGVVTVLASPKSLNTAGYGAPTFSWNNYALSITNPNFPVSGVTVYCMVVPISNAISLDRFSQY